METRADLIYEFEGRKGDKRHLSHSCPQGMTMGDLLQLFDNIELPKFLKWMTGQTQSICDGKRYHHDRYHNEDCMGPISPGYAKAFPDVSPHTPDSPHDWRCGYVGTGYYEDTECVNNPHGVVTYPWDVARYLNGYPIID